MTGDEFHARYALLEQVAGEGARSFHAVTPGGGVVMVHFLDGGVTQANLALLSTLERLEPGRRARVREVTAVDGAIAVVTDLIPDFRSLHAWLEAPVAPPADARETPPPSAPPADAPAEVPSAPAGEFTRLFRAVDPGEAFPPAAASAPPASDPAPRPGSAPATGSIPSPGSTESMPSPGGAPAAGIGDLAGEESAGGSGPGEFTRLFRALDADALSGAASGGLRTPVQPASPAERLPESGASPAARPGRASAEAPPPSPWPASPPAVDASPPAVDEGGPGADAGPPEPLPPSLPAAAPRLPEADGVPRAPGATGVFAAMPAPPRDGPAEPPAGDPPAGGAYTRLFQRLELPEWTAHSRDRPSGDADPLPRSSRPGDDAGRSGDDDYLERLYTPSADLPHTPADAPSAPQAPAPAAFSASAAPPPPAFAAPLSAPPAAVSPPPPASVPAAALPSHDASRPSSVLVAGLATVAVLAILLVLFVVLR
jgi:hypothetical protein